MFTCEKMCKSCKIGCAPECYFPLNKETLCVKYAFALSFFYNHEAHLCPLTVSIGWEIGHMTVCGSEPFLVEKQNIRGWR